MSTVLPLLHVAYQPPGLAVAIVPDQDCFPVNAEFRSDEEIVDRDILND